MLAVLGMRETRRVRKGVTDREAMQAVVEPPQVERTGAPLLEAGQERMVAPGELRGARSESGVQPVVVVRVAMAATCKPASFRTPLRRS
jgi:hypothetical protein